MTGKETEYKVFVTGCVTVHVCNFLAGSFGGATPKTAGSTLWSQVSLFLFFWITPSEWDVIQVWEEEKVGWLALSQVIRVDNGKVRVLAVGGALVWAGGARGGAGHQGVMEGPGRALGLYSHQAAPSPDWRGALGRSPSSSSVGGLQVSVLGHEDVVVPVLTLGAEGRRHLHETWRGSSMVHVCDSAPVPSLICSGPAWVNGCTTCARTERLYNDCLLLVWPWSSIYSNATKLRLQGTCD